MMSGVDLSAPPSVRVGAFVLVAVLHVLAVVALIRAFAPDFANTAVATVVATFTVAATAPTPTPTPAPPPAPKSGAAAGAAGAAGKHAVPRAVMAPQPRQDVPHVSIAPAAASTGIANSSGARDAGSGTGAGGQGSGTGSGGSGNGQGGGGGSKPVKIAGEINSARDYPIASRDLRIGDYVVVWVTVGTDGRPTGCRVKRPSRDPQADAITCRLAIERFRFKPATGPVGQPVVATFGWRQRWYYQN